MGPKCEAPQVTIFDRNRLSSSTGSPSIANKNLNGATSTNAPSPAAPTMRECPTDITQPQT